MSEHNSRTSRASLFDIRNIIAALLGIYGVVLVIMSFTTSDSDLAKVSGVNANLWVGIGLLLFALFFMVWAYLRPIVVDEEQLERDKREVDEEANRRREAGPTT
jgi:uncharacterized membrane protein